MTSLPGGCNDIDSFLHGHELLFQVHLPEPLMLFRFLCVLWGHSSNHDNQLDAHIDVILQTQALHMGGALLAKQPAAILEELAAANSPGENPEQGL